MGPMKARNTSFKASAAVCAVLVGTLGFSGLASAQDRDDHRGRDHRAEQRQDFRGDRDHRGGGGDRGGREWRNGNHQQQRFIAQQDHRWQNGRQDFRGGPRFARGGYLPPQYRSHSYYVSNWRAYHGLYAPPNGQQWVNVDGQFLLVALTSGLIANALLN
jgi:Ni/Co efflux regulator RcnB